MLSNTRKRITTRELCRRYNEGVRDFSHIILKNKDLRNADLREANFSGAILTGTNFKGAKLQHTKFSTAKLKGVDFSQADLTGADFSYAKASFLYWGKITPLVILPLGILLLFNVLAMQGVSQAEYEDTLIGLLFIDIVLLIFVPFLSSFIPIWIRTLRRRTKFDQSNLNGANFTNAQLEGIDFSKNLNLERVNFHKALLQRANFTGGKLEESDFSRANLAETDFSKANLTRANFSQVKASFLHWKRIMKLLILLLGVLLLLNWLIRETVSSEEYFDTLISLLFFGIILLIFIPFLSSFIPISVRTLRKKTNFYKSNLNGTDFRCAKLQDIDFSKSISLEKVNFHNASLQRANFKGISLEESDFSNAKLYGTNFSKTKLKQSNFSRSQSGISFCFGIHCFNIIIFSFFGFVIAWIPALSLFSLLEYQIRSSTSEIQYFSVFIYILIVLVGFLHFLCSSVFKNIDETVAGIGLIILTILLVMTNQPIIIILALVIILIAIIRIIQILWGINPFALTLLPLFLIILCGLILYNYNYLKDSDLYVIENTAGFLVIFMFISIRIAVTMAELEIILGWGKWISGDISIALFLLFQWFVVWMDLFESNFDKILFVCLTVGSILLGWNLGAKAIEDNPNCRAIRDRAVCLFHLFGRFGTRFRDSDLTLADFSFASLKNADLTNANLTHAIWNGTRRLEYAKFGRNNYLRYAEIRQLFSNHFPPQSRSIRKLIRIYRNWPNSLKKLIHFCLRERTYTLTKDFNGCDLRGIRLSYYDHSSHHRSFNLSNASFEDADLRRADLRGANLQGVSFVNTQLDEADLSYSDLTDACIQDWEITRNTRFEEVRCKRVQLEKRISKDIEPASQTLNEETNIDVSQLQTLVISDQEQQKLDKLKHEFAKLNLIRNKVNRRYHLIQKANDAEESDGIPSELYIQMFEMYRKQRIQAQRKQSWWQSIVWFKIEPWIEKVNEWTQELDIFPLLENLGRLSILVAVITFFNGILKPDLEKRYRPWEIIHSDTEEVGGVSRFALQQLLQEGGNLTYLKAEEAQLQKINLSEADLSNGNFYKAKLNGADLRGSKLVEANLSEADLSGAKLANSSKDHPLRYITPDFIQDMKETNLEKANLTGANLTKADLTNTDLTRAIWTGAIWTGAILKEANLTNMDFKNTDLTDVNLTKADLTNTDLTGANLTKADLTNTDLTNTNLTGVIWTGAILKEANLTNMDLKNIYLKDVNLTNSILENADLTGANLINTDLEGAYLTDANLTNTNLEGADLTNTYLGGANLTGAILTNANLEYANLEYANLSKTALTYEQIKSACNWRLAAYTKAEWNDQNKIWLAEDEDANQRKIKEIEDAPAPDLCR